METSIVKLFGLDFNPWIILMSWISMAILLLLAWLASRRLQLIPKGWQNAMEIAIEFVEEPIKESIGKRGVKYTYFFSSLFLYILISNMLGLVPGLASPTSDVSVTFCLAVLVMIWVQYITIREIGFIGYLKHYLSPSPFFVVFHLLDLVTRPLTMALRLFGNIFAGEILVKVLTENFHYLAPSAWLLISIAIGGIQAYIFTLLSIAYTGLSVGTEHNH